MCVLTPHSQINTALINNCVVLDTIERHFIERAYAILKTTVREPVDILFVSPDVGAYKRVSSYAKMFDEPLTCAVKTRDKKGNIKLTLTDESVRNKDCIIIDDMLDGGRTFIELAKQLRSKGANIVSLIVTHAYFSQGVDGLLEQLDYIITTNSYPSEQVKPSNRIRKLDLKSLYNE